MSGTFMAIGCTFYPQRGGALSFSEDGSVFVMVAIYNCIFTADSNTHDEDASYFIFPRSITIDYGNCTPGRTPGDPGANVLVTDVGNFTGCPFQCPKGTFGPGGATDVLRAIDSGCAVGCESCPAGAVCDALGLPAPIICTAGHYNPDLGSQTSGSCRPCESGSFQTETGATACNGCAAGSFARHKGSTACQQCAAGGYCEEVGASSASVFELCPPGTWSRTVGLNSSEGCHPCGAATYQPITGASSSDACLPCPQGTASAGLGMRFCSPCPGGRFQNSTGGLACEQCMEGSYCPEGAANPFPCSRGTYSTATNLTSAIECTACPRGFCTRPQLEHGTHVPHASSSAALSRGRVQRWPDGQVWRGDLPATAKSDLCWGVSAVP